MERMSGRENREEEAGVCMYRFHHLAVVFFANRIIHISFNLFQCVNALHNKYRHIVYSIYYLYMHLYCCHITNNYNCTVRVFMYNIYSM